MISKKLIFISALFFYLGSSLATINAQVSVYQDFSSLMDIPNISSMQASETHLYVLSESEGMAVFRIYPDNLQWLYTSSGMQRRGNSIDADVRFAYLYGDSRRLTVLEPTSVLGVFSSTNLPATPQKAVRIENNLFVAMGNEGLGMISLESAESIDSKVTLVGTDQIRGASVIDAAASDVSKQLLVLTSNNQLHIYRMKDNVLAFESTIRLNADITSIFLDADKIFGATDNGSLHAISSNGSGRSLGNVGSKVESLIPWQAKILIRTQNGSLWILNENNSLTEWKKDSKAANFITKSENRVWLAENNKVSELKISSTEAESNFQPTTGNFKIKNIPNQILTYPNALILGLELENNYPTQNVEFSYRSNVSSALIKNQGMVWQPSVNQVGMNFFTIVATNSAGFSDSTRFAVDVRSFNSPPRFSPVRVSSIAMNELYQLQFKAIDPEEPNSSLIRYLGVDLPEGARLDEQSGLFSWTPNERQVGKNDFRIIATDKLGAAASIDVSLTVLDISREN